MIKLYFLNFFPFQVKKIHEFLPFSFLLSTSRSKKTNISVLPLRAILYSSCVLRDTDWMEKIFWSWKIPFEKNKVIFLFSLLLNLLSDVTLNCEESNDHFTVFMLSELYVLFIQHEESKLVNPMSYGASSLVCCPHWLVSCCAER